MLFLTFPAPVDTNGDLLYDGENAARGAEVQLETDRTQDVRDGFGRALAYVTVVGERPPVVQAQEDYDLGAVQLLGGWADVYIFDDTPFQRLDEYESVFDTAATSGTGVHGLCGGDFHAPA
jgi:hypothetical protein